MVKTVTTSPEAVQLAELLIQRLVINELKLRSKEPVSVVAEFVETILSEHHKEMREALEELRECYEGD